MADYTNEDVIKRIDRSDKARTEEHDEILDLMKKHQREDEEGRGELKSDLSDEMGDHAKETQKTVKVENNQNQGILEETRDTVQMASNSSSESQGSSRGDTAPDRLSELLTQVTEGREENNQRFAKIEERIEAGEKRADERQEENNTRFENVERISGRWWNMGNVILLVIMLIGVGAAYFLHTNGLGITSQNEKKMNLWSDIDPPKKVSPEYKRQSEHLEKLTAQIDDFKNKHTNGKKWISEHGEAEKYTGKIGKDLSGADLRSEMAEIASQIRELEEMKEEMERKLANL
ncbi:MAG: hypothetical protein ACI83O_000663 [Patescibacteria group bacterium]|jgi:hypothetical protein